MRDMDICLLTGLEVVSGLVLRWNRGTAGSLGKNVISREREEGGKEGNCMYVLYLPIPVT